MIILANILVNSNSIQDFSNIVKAKSSELSDEFNSLIALIGDAKEVIESNNGSIEYIDEIGNNLKDLNNSFSSFNSDFLEALQGILINYQQTDQSVNSNVSKLDGATAVMSVGAGGLAASGFDFSKVSGNAHDASNGNFINESKVHSSAFGEGEYTFQYREDGSVRIDKNGVPMAFTTKENADKITGGIDKKTESASTLTETKRSIKLEHEEAKRLSSSENVQEDSSKTNNEFLERTEETHEDLFKTNNEFLERAEEVHKDRLKQEALYGGGPWSDVTISKKKPFSGYGGDNYIVQQTTYKEGPNTRTMVVLASGEYVTVPGGKVNSVNSFNTTLMNALSPEQANAKLLPETRKKIYEYKQSHLDK